MFDIVEGGEKAPPFTFSTRLRDAATNFRRKLDISNITSVLKHRNIMQVIRRQLCPK